MKKLMLFCVLFFAACGNNVVEHPIAGHMLLQDLPPLPKRVDLPPIKGPMPWNYPTPRTTEWHVTETGSGLMDGTAANPASVAKANSYTFAAGDTINFTGTISSRVFVTTSGTSAARITYNFKGATLTYPGVRIVSQEKSFVNLFGGTMGPTGAGPSGQYPVIYSNDWPGSDITISGWTFDAGNDSFAEFVAMPSWTSGVTIENNHVDNVGRFVRMQRANTGTVIRNNWMRSTTAGGVGTWGQPAGVAPLQVDLIFVGDATNMTIEGNYINNRSPGAGNGNHSDNIQNFYANCCGPVNWVLKYNWVELSNTAGDGSDTWVQFQDQWVDPAALFCSNVFVGGAAYANGGLSMAFNNTEAAGFYLYNNTFVRRASPSFTLRLEYNGVPNRVPGRLHAVNNVHYLTEAVGASTFFLDRAIEATDWNYNYAFNTVDCSATWSGASGSCSKDPLLTNVAGGQFWPASGSPLIGAGTAMPGAACDKGIAPGATWPNPALVARTGAWDVGAYVVSGGTPVEPPPDAVVTPPIVIPPPTEPTEPPPTTEEPKPPKPPNENNGKGKGKQQ